MNWRGLPNPHPAALSEGCIWMPERSEGFTAMCMVTHEVGYAGPDEAWIIQGSTRPSEARLMDLALHMLSCNCGWSHEAAAGGGGADDAG